MASFIYIALKCPSFLIFQTTDLVCEGKNDKAAVTIQLTGQYGTGSSSSFFLPYPLQNLNNLFSLVCSELRMTLVLHNVDFIGLWSLFSGSYWFTQILNISNEHWTIRLKVNILLKVLQKISVSCDKYLVSYLYVCMFPHHRTVKKKRYFRLLSCRISESIPKILVGQKYAVHLSVYGCCQLTHSQVQWAYDNIIIY